MPTGKTTSKQLLAKIKLDQDDWKRQVQSIQDTIKYLREEQKKDLAAQKEAQKEISNNLRELAAFKREEARTSKAESDELYARMKFRYDKEFALLKQEFLEKKKNATQYATEAAALSKKMYENDYVLIKGKFDAEKVLIMEIKDIAIREEKLKQLEYKKSIDMLRLEAHSAQRGISMTHPPVVPGAGGPGFFGRMAGGYMQGGIYGAVGSVATGVIAGQLGVMLIERAIEKFKALTEHIKEAGEEAALEAQQEHTLRVVGGERMGEMEDFVLKMRNATRHLADDSAIFGMATQAFRANTKVTGEQIVELTNAAVKLGIAAHGPSGVTYALSAVQSYLISGRSYALAYALGLSSADRQLLMSGMRSTSAAQQMTQFNTTLERVIEASKKVPEPLMTVSLAQTQFAVTLGHLEHEMAGVLQTSPGLVAIWESLAKMIASFLEKFDTNKKEFTKIIDSFTDLLADFAVVGVTAAKVMVEAFGWIMKSIKGVQSVLAERKMESEGEEQAVIERKIQALQHPELISGNLKAEMDLRGEMVEKGYLPKGRMSFTKEEMDKARKQYIQSLENEAKVHEQNASDARKMSDDSYDAYANSTNAVNLLTGALEQLRTDIANRRKSRPEAYAEGVPAGDQWPLSEQQKLEILKKNLQNELALKDFSVTKDKEAQQKKLEQLQESLKIGEISQSEYAREATKIYDTLYAGEIALIHKKRDIQIATYRSSLQDARMIAPEIVKVRIDSDKAEFEAKAKHDQELRKLDVSLTDQQRKIRQQDIDADKTDQMDRLGFNKQINEETYQQGFESLQNYEDNRKSLFETEKIILKDHYDEQVKMAGENVEQLNQLQHRYLHDVAAIDKEIAAIDSDTEVKKRQEYEQTYQFRLDLLKQIEQMEVDRYGGMGLKGTLFQGIAQTPYLYREAQQTQENIQKNLPEIARRIPETPETAVATQRIQDLSVSISQLSSKVKIGTKDYDDYLHKLQQLLDLISTLPPETQRAIMPFVQQLSHATTSLGQLDDQVKKSADALPNTFADLAQIAGQFAPELSNLFSVFEGVFRKMKEGSPSFFGDMRDAFKGRGSYQPTTDTGEENPLNKASARIQAIVEDIAKIGVGVIGMVQTVKSAQSPLSGAASGAAAGAQIGMAAAGPWGALIGAAVGGIAGAISGAIHRGTEKIKETINQEMSNISRWYQNGTITLTQALADVEKEYETNLRRLHGKAYIAMKEQLDQLKSQLLQQQKQIITSFEANLDILNMGPYLQDTASQIESIIQKWNEYVSAGGDVAKANQFLKESFANLNQTSLQSLDQSYQSAIQNALNYNQLLYQRAQLIDQEAQQERDILNQGVLVRQTTVAQTKAYQIELLRQQRDQQLEALNEQITVSKYQLDVQSKIFDLTGTRVDLETKLATVQMALIDFDMQRIAALKGVVDQFNATGVPMAQFIAGLITTLTQGTANGTQTASSYAALAEALGINFTQGGAVRANTSNPATPTTVQTGSSTQLEALLNSYYQTYSRYGMFSTPGR